MTRALWRGGLRPVPATGSRDPGAGGARRVRPLHRHLRPRTLPVDATKPPTREG